MIEAGAVSAERDDDVLVITLDRPHRRNALDPASIDALCAALDDANGSDDIKAIVVTGSGQAFCVGGDISGGAETFAGPPSPETAAAVAKRDRGGVLALRLFGCLKPVVAAVNGDAVGLGSTMLLPMDARIAVPKARFGFPFVRRGIVPESASTWFLPRLVGMPTALRWTLSGKIFSAEEAAAAGLIDKIVDPRDLRVEAIAVARELSHGVSGPAVAATRQLLWHGLTLAHPMAAHRAESAAIRHLGSGEDAREGITAFLEKRPAAFTGSTRAGVDALLDWWRQPPYDETAPVLDPPARTEHGGDPQWS